MIKHEQIHKKFITLSNLATYETRLFLIFTQKKNKYGNHIMLLKTISADVTMTDWSSV